MRPAGQEGQGDQSGDAVFDAAVADLHAGRDAQLPLRPQVSFEDVPAPRRLAPHAAAIAATVCAARDDDQPDIAWGRLVLLYDPDGQPGWAGQFRVVAYIRADVEPEIAADPLLGSVSWSWLTEALDARAAGYAAPSGTVTRVVTEGFGGKQGEPPVTGLELRASWSPAGPLPRPRRRPARARRARRRLVRRAVRGGRAAAGGGRRDRPAETQAALVTEASQQPEDDDVVPLLEPRDGLPAVVSTPDALSKAVLALAHGDGPVAVDAERASGFRYGQRAFLVQLRREGSGTVLIDPVACPDLSALDAALAPAEIVLHAAGQDLPCLAELGYRPRALFDTELAGRLLGFPRVGLAALVEEVLGLRLAKGHGAEDWSTRPLPDEWLRYAALDVEVLVELRDALAGQLEEQGKTEWARQEFAAVLAARPPGPRPESVAAHLGHSPCPHPPRAGRGPRALAGAGRHSQTAGHVARAGAARRRDGRGRADAADIRR